MKLKDKVAIITGAGRGMGRAAALLFAKEGASIVIAEIDEDTGRKTKSDIVKAGGKAIFIKTDVSKSEDVKNLVGKTIKEFGKLHIVYNNAAVFWFGKDGYITDIDEATWDRVLDINLKGTYLCCKYAIPEIIKSGGGSIINTSSSAGLIGIPKCDAYTATKGAVIALTRSMGVEYAPKNIRVNCIAPVAIQTEMVKESNLIDPEFDENKFLQSTPIRRWGKPEEIAKVALFLASDDSSYLVGSVVVADGGITIQ
jgi:NAD(P)-dependent dehydrogenase (short-subunit alcohol dehydrogenase family)